VSRQRIIELNEALGRRPEHEFALYALAMEHASLGELERALELFEQLVRTHPNYVPAYQQYASVLARLRRYDRMRTVLQSGLVHAQEHGQFHARDKMRDMLSQLP